MDEDQKRAPVADVAAAKGGAQGAVEPEEQTLAQKIDRLHHEMLNGTRLGNDTESWNLVHAFKEKVKELVGADRPA